jgi:hypothetical protein
MANGEVKSVLAHEHFSAWSGDIYSFYESANAVWIDGPDGIHGYDKRTSEERPRTDIAVEPFSFHRLGKTLWITAKKGLFRLSYDSDAALEKVDGGHFPAFFESEDQLWFGGNSLLVWQKGSPKAPERVPIDIGSISSIHGSKDRLWLGSERGLFQLGTKPMSSPRRVSLEGYGEVTQVFDFDGTLFLIAWREVRDALKLPVLLMLPDPSLRLPPAIDEPPTEIMACGRVKFYVSGNTLFIVPSQWDASHGALVRRWNKRDENLPVTAIERPISHVLESEDSLWFPTLRDDFLFRWHRDSTAPPEQVVGPEVIGQTAGVVERKNDFVVVATEGLFLVEKKTSQEARILPERYIRVMTARDDTIWFVGRNGIYRVDGLVNDWRAKIDFLQWPSPETSSGEETVVHWRISDYAWHTTKSLVKQRLTLTDSSHNVVQLPRDGYVKEDSFDEKGDFVYTLPGLKKGKYYLGIEAVDLMGRGIKSKELNLEIGRTTLEFVESWARVLAMIYAALGVVIFVTLAICSRWSESCFDILTDPITQGVFVYFGFALRHLRFVRLWICERYFEELCQHYKPQHRYLTVALYGQEGNAFRSTDIWRVFANQLQEPSRRVSNTEVSMAARLWVHGRPGCGKTELVHEICHQYTQSSSLRKAWAKHRTIPVPMGIRDCTVTNPKDPVVELVAKSMAQFRFRLGDEGFLSSLLDCGDFLLVFDGLNEATLDPQVADFAVTHPSVGIIATSQTAAPAGKFEEYQLPVITGSFAKDLLRLWLAPSLAESVIDGSPQLWSEIRSGYDVALVARLALAGKQVPRGRLELFDLSLRESLHIFGEGGTELALVCRVAWQLWLSGRRQFEPDGQLTAEVIAALDRANLVALRGNLYEFSHDLMRAYLAARWLAVHSPSLAAVQSSLDQAEVWKLAREEQDSVFTFLTNLVDDATLEALYRFAIDDADLRSRLLIAILQVGRSRDLEFARAEYLT